MFNVEDFFLFSYTVHSYTFFHIDWQKIYDNGKNIYLIKEIFLVIDEFFFQLLLFSGQTARNKTAMELRYRMTDQKISGIPEECHSSVDVTHVQPKKGTYALKHVAGPLSCDFSVKKKKNKKITKSSVIRIELSSNFHLSEWYF